MEENDRKLFLVGNPELCTDYTLYKCSMLLSLSYQLQERKSIINCSN